MGYISPKRDWNAVAATVAAAVAAAVTADAADAASFLGRKKEKEELKKRKKKRGKKERKETFDSIPSLPVLALVPFFLLISVASGGCVSLSLFLFFCLWLSCGLRLYLYHCLSLSLFVPGLALCFMRPQICLHLFFICHCHQMIICYWLHMFPRF